MQTDPISPSARAVLERLDRTETHIPNVAVTRLDIPFEDILATVLKIYASVLAVTAAVALPLAVIYVIATR